MNGLSCECAANKTDSKKEKNEKAIAALAVVMLLSLAACGGQGGAKNAYGTAKVNIELPAGNYAIADSDQTTRRIDNMQMRLYGIAFMLAGIIMLIITVVQWLKFRSFRNCEVTTANVLAVDSAKHYSNNRSRTTFSMKLSYNVEGANYERNLACDAEEYRLGANRQVEIRYKSKNPQKILLNAGEKQARGQRILWIITLALLAIGAVMTFVLAR